MRAMSPRSAIVVVILVAGWPAFGVLGSAAQQPNPAPQPGATSGAGTTSQPTTAPERFMSDEEFLKIGQEFDLDAFIKSLNPPTIEEILKSLEPIPTLEQILDDLKHPERRPKPPTLPEDVARQVEELEKRIEELKQKGALGPDTQAQEQALDEAVRLAEQVVKLRTVAGQPADWYEVADARQLVETLKHTRGLPNADRTQWAAAAVRDSERSALRRRGEYKRATGVARSQLAIYRRLFPGDHPDVAGYLHNVAFAIVVEGGSRAEAEPLSCEALAMHQRLFPGDHPGVAQILSNLATVLRARGALAEAEALFRDALAMRQRLFRGDHPDVAQGLNNLAVVLDDRGALAEAESLYREALAMEKRLFLGDHPDVANGLNNLAYVLQVRGALAEAEPLFREALAMRQRLFPADHPDVAISLNNLADLLRVRGALAEAELLSRGALAMKKRLFLGDHPAVALGLNNLAVVLHDRGALAESESLYRDALAMRQRLFPADHPDVAISLNNLAGILRARGALAEAELLVRDTLAMRQRLFPGDHPDVATSLNNLALILYDRGALAQAEPLCRDALAMLQRLHHEDHPYVATNLIHLATILKDRGALAEAEPHYRNALAMYRRLFPGDHPYVASSLSNLAGVLKDRGALARAEPLDREAFEMSERLRAQIIGGEQERAAFAAKLRLSARAHVYANLLAQLHRDAEALGILERGRARAALDLLERSGRDLVAEATALGDTERSQRLAEAQASEQGTQIDLNSAEALLAGRRKERDALEKRDDLDAEAKARQSAAYDQQIAALVDEVKQKRQALTQAGGTVLNELRGLFPAGQALTTEEILSGLAPDEAIVSFGWSEDSVLVATATSGKTGAAIVAKDKEAAKRLSELAGQVRTALANRPSAGSDLDPAVTRELATTLLPEPVRAAIADAHRLVVLPDGPLNDIPLEVLAEAEPSLALADKTIVYAPSATVYLDRVKRGRALAGKAADSVLVLGDPVFDRGREKPTYPGQGVLIAAAVEGGNAAKAGLKRGDVLLRYDEQTLDEQTPLPKAIGAVNEAIQKGDRPADQAVKITYWRDGQEAQAELPPGKLGVQVRPGNPADGLRSMALLDRGFDAVAAQANALDQVRLFGGALPPLPGTRREAEAIAALFQHAGAGRVADSATPSGPTVRLLLDEQATLANLTEQAPGVRYLHLATHGLMGSAERPYDASLALTQPQEPTPEDIGFLRLQDLISKWAGRLNECELVVLSACDTQRGVRQGDSVMSLPLGFFFAGAPTVVASLWKVDDTATALLMQRFYENLVGSSHGATQPRSHEGEPGAPMSKAEALRAAKLWLRNLTADEALALAAQLPGSQDRGTVREGPATEEPSSADHPYAAPYYWAAFILLGDPD